ncbi:MAG: HAD family phosphatase [Ferruginibacter sp.]
MAFIKNIIFDLGGVLLNIDYKKTEKAFNDLGVVNFKDMYAQFTADKLFESLETGHINEENFYECMTERGVKPLQIKEVQNAWNAMLLDFRMESLHFLETLEGQYKLYLLSNTNAIHKAAFDTLFTAQTGFLEIEKYFTKTYYSHLIGLRKPHTEIYDFVLNDAGIIAGETLFIDDSINNIESAAQIGILTHLLKPGEKIEDLVY